MRRVPYFFGLHAEPPRFLHVSLLLLPFLLLVIVYMGAAQIRHAENPKDKLLPTFSQMAAAVKRMAFTQDRRTGDYVMVKDTVSSLRRIAMGVSLAASTALFAGLAIGLYPGLRSTFLSFVTFLSMIPPLSILPILFISFGVDELAKVMLIFIGLFPLITRDIYLAVGALPREQITKSLTLGATHLSVAWRIVMPQVMPRLIDSVRLALGAAWLFLIASEAIASTDGLGYRIFLLRRYLAMDAILPYVLWITVLGYLIDWALIAISRFFFPWYAARGK